MTDSVLVLGWISYYVLCSKHLVTHGDIFDPMVDYCCRGAQIKLELLKA